MVLCKIGKYYNQVKFQVLWPRLKVGSNTVMFKSRARKQMALFVDQNLLEGGSKSFFAYLPTLLDT